MDEKNNYLHRYLPPFNGLQDGTPYVGGPVDNIPEFMNLDKILNRDILHSLCFHCVLSRFFLKGEGNDEEEKYRFSYATPKEITSGLTHIL